MNPRQITPFLLALTAVGTSVATAVASDENKSKPVTSWTCADFLAVDDQFKPKIVYAASTFAKGGKPRDEVIDIDGAEKVTPMIIGDCHKAPQSSFMQNLKRDWTKVEADAKAEAKKVDKKL